MVVPRISYGQHACLFTRVVSLSSTTEASNLTGHLAAIPLSPPHMAVLQPYVKQKNSTHLPPPPQNKGRNVERIKYTHGNALHGHPVAATVDVPVTSRQSGPYRTETELNAGYGLRVTSTNMILPAARHHSPFPCGAYSPHRLRRGFLFLRHTGGSQNKGGAFRRLD